VFSFPQGKNSSGFAKIVLFTFPVFTWREERTLRVLENEGLRRIFWPKRGDVTGSRKNCVMMSFMGCTAHLILFG
jgi:hypothetical protein